MNQVLAYVSTYNITELNELHYVGAKLVCEKIVIPSKSAEEKSKPGWEFRLETQIKNLRKQKIYESKNDKTKEDARIIRKKNEKTTREKLTIQLEEINRKVLAKEGR